MPSNPIAKPAIGLLLAAITILVILHEWGAASWADHVERALVVVVIAILALRVPVSRKGFIAVGFGLTVALAMSSDNWWPDTQRALSSAGFIAAFFSALSTLRNAAQSSPSIQRAGRFLSGQKPGWRYAALTLGGQMFGLLLNYGSIQLLGSLAVANASSEPNLEVRAHRVRRMLLAIQRAFISTLPWSPLSFAVVISTTIIPGTAWTTVVLPGMATSAIVAGLGWALDTLFKPKLSSPAAPRQAPEGNWLTMTPLVILLALLVTGVTSLYLTTGVRIVGIVAVLVPSIAFVWIAIQNRGNAPLRALYRRVRAYLFDELPGFQGELTLLMMAGYIGTIGAALLLPLILSAGIDLSNLPTWVILVAIVWFIPAMGQLGMNPILSVTLFAPLIPSADALGISPTALVVAITSGWAVGGITSPFTATTLLIGSFAGVSAAHVGLRWNGIYALLCLIALSGWALLFAFVL